jgi:hypothetical protein
MQHSVETSKLIDVGVYTKLRCSPDVWHTSNGGYITVRQTIRRWLLVEISEIFETGCDFLFLLARNRKIVLVTEPFIQ